MNTIDEHAGQPAPQSLLDESGFLPDGAHWSPEIANAIARGEGIARLGYEHWRILHGLRAYHHRFHAAPGWRRLCRHTDLRPDQASSLFASAISAWRIAGLPYPGEEAVTYMH